MRINNQQTAPLGELVATVFDEAAMQCIDPQEISHLATWTLANIFRQYSTTIVVDKMPVRRHVIRDMA